MPQLRKDPVTSRWVIVTPEETAPASSFSSQPRERSSRICPFCPGNESMTPPEILSYPKLASTSEKSSWQLRVIPNKFPALRIEESNQKQGIGIYDKVGGFGAHEVIIENPAHDKEIADLPLEAVEMILKVYRNRCLDLQKDSRFKYILIFKNYGADAGASLEHPHSQLIALPVVPSRVSGEVKGGVKHYEYTDRCIFCDMIHQEERARKLTVFDEGGFISMTPFASRFPFETWVMPKTHSASFEHMSDSEIPALARALQSTLFRIKKALNDPSYNFMIHTIPIRAKEEDSFHWHIEIIPHLTEVSGFELGTGFYLNPTTPELAAKTLREVI